MFKRILSSDYETICAIHPMRLFPLTCNEIPNAEQDCLIIEFRPTIREFNLFKDISYKSLYSSFPVRFKSYRKYSLQSYES